ncbi:MAG: Flp pilus assembly complex ATPase component TadA [Bdellovibrionales bacterium]|nr:Flp pilus assembly complex ATPase component TadA [Bdellovibrionales bacterium]
MLIVVKIEALLEGESHTLEKKFDAREISIGRDPANDVVLSDGRVSGRHATLKVHESSRGGFELVVRDNNSSNGTYVEDTPVAPQTDTPLAEGSRLVIGNFVLTPRVEASSAEKPKSQAVPNAKSAAVPDKKKSGSTPQSMAVSMATGGSQRRKGLRDDELRIKREIHTELIKRLDLRRKDIVSLSDEDLRSRARNVVEEVLVDLRWEIPDGLHRESLIKEILDEALGLGPLEVLLADDDVSEVMVNNYAQIYAERNGKLELTDLQFSGEPAVLAAIERIISPIGRRVDESSPIVDARLKDGSRVNAVIRPLALQGPCITIRKFARVPLTIDDLVRFNSLSRGMAEFLKMAIENRLNVVISGGTGSGKTTLLNVISGFIPPGERVITVEDAAELRLPQEHVISFETRPPNLEGKGAIQIRDLVKNSLRMRPDRIIVGECRGAEALDMLQAMNTGHDGSMTTGHANSAEDMVRRLETMVLTSGLDLPIRAVREQIGSAVDIIVQQTRFGCGTRKVTGITEVVGMDYDEGVVQLQDVFVFRQSGYGADGKVAGEHRATGYIPKFFKLLQERGLPVNAEVFALNQ